MDDGSCSPSDYGTRSNVHICFHFGGGAASTRRYHAGDSADAVPGADEACGKAISAMWLRWIDSHVLGCV